MYIFFKGALPKSAFCTLAVFLALICNLPVQAQTYRGGINGTVTDKTAGAAIANANVSAVETATNTSYHAASSSAGEFSA